MKIHVLFAALGMALALPMPVLAAEHHRGPGHYEWQPAPQFGPRATGPAQRRVWVPDEAQAANCDCAMMKMSANECMMPMHHMGSHGPGQSGS